MAEEDQEFDYSTAINEARFAQRYVLVVFYYSTGGDSTWTRQSAFLSPTLHECEWQEAAPPGILSFTGFNGVVGCLFDPERFDRFVFWVEFGKLGRSAQPAPINRYILTM